MPRNFKPKQSACHVCSLFLLSSCSYVLSPNTPFFPLCFKTSTLSISVSPVHLRQRRGLPLRPQPHRQQRLQQAQLLCLRLRPLQVLRRAPGPPAGPGRRPGPRPRPGRRRGALTLGGTVGGAAPASPGRRRRRGEGRVPPAAAQLRDGNQPGKGVNEKMKARLSQDLGNLVENQDNYGYEMEAEQKKKGQCAAFSGTRYSCVRKLYYCMCPSLNSSFQNRCLALLLVSW